jgi:hypothetical protein
MECPAEILPLLTDILRDVRHSIRAHGSSGCAKRCAVKADHIHDLPHLIADYRPELLEFYWNIERPAYLRASANADVEKFREQWIGLAEFLKATSAARTTAGVRRGQPASF